MKIDIREHGRLSEASSGDKSVFPVTIITEGEGSSGVYTRELLQASESAGVFNKGTKSFIDHPADATKPWERSLSKIAGKLVEDAHYVEENGVAMLKSKLKVSEKYQSFVEEYKDVIGVSIYIGAYGEDTNDNGKAIIQEFDAADPYKSVDLVVAAGRGGRFDLAMESYRQIETSENDSENGSGNPAEPHHHKKEISAMEIDELAGKVDTLTKAVEGLATLHTDLVERVAAVQESLKPAEPVEIDEEQVVENLIESGLTKRSRKAVLEAVRNGAAVEDAIKDQKAVEDEFRAELKPVQEGRVFGTSDSKFESAIDLGKVLR